MSATADDTPGRQYRRLLDTYGIPEDRRAGWLVEMADAFGHYPLAVLTRATDEYVRKVRVPAEQYHEVPTPGTFAEWVYRAMDEAERAEQKALPAPRPVVASGWERKTGPERVAFLERHLAIGVLKARGHPLPSEADIAGVIGQNRARRFCFGTLERIGAGEAVSPAELVGGAWPGAGR